MKKLTTTAVLIALTFSASAMAESLVTVKNVGDKIFLRETGLPYMKYIAAPLKSLDKKQNDQFTAVSLLPPDIGIDSIKLVYGSEDNDYSPACEFVLQIVPDLRTKYFKVQKVSATQIRRNYKTSMQCDSGLTSVDPYTGKSAITFTMRASKLIGVNSITTGDPSIQEQIEE